MKTYELLAIFMMSIMCVALVAYSVPHTMDDYGYKEFRSVAQLKIWLGNDDTDQMEWINNTFDCDDFSRMLVDHARADGYKVYTYNVAYHMKCMTTINGIIYGIEPQTDNIINYGAEI